MKTDNRNKTDVAGEVKKTYVYTMDLHSKKEKKELIYKMWFSHETKSVLNTCSFYVTQSNTTN